MSAEPDKAASPVLSACCERDPGPFVNDETMDAIRVKYRVMDSILKNPAYDGKQIQHEISVVFRELHHLRSASDNTESPS